MYQQMEVLIIDSRAPLLLLGGTLPRVDGYFFREKKELRTNVLNYFDEKPFLPSFVDSIPDSIERAKLVARRNKKKMKINTQFA